MRPGTRAPRRVFHLEPAAWPPPKGHDPAMGNGVTIRTEEEWRGAAFLAKSLSDPNRLRILLYLGNGSRPVSAIVEAMGLSQPLVSHHLKELRRSLLVKVERSGPFVYYEIADARITKILEALKDLATDLLAARKTF